LKEIIREELIGTKINFEINDTKKCNITDKFNLCYIQFIIQSINNIVRPIKMGVLNLGMRIKSYLCY